MNILCCYDVLRAFVCWCAQVMLLGAHPKDTIDKDMRVTVAFNHFGANLVERMPR
jgi:hypothetical protein